MAEMITPDVSPSGHAVLVIDVLSDFRFPDAAAYRRALQRQAGNIDALLRRARRHCVPVIYVNDSPGLWRSDAPGLIKAGSAPDSPGREIVRRLAPHAQDHIILKPRHSVFYGSPLASVLEDLKVKALTLTGVSAESCVWISACDAHVRNYSLIIPEDCVAGRTAVATKNMLRNAKQIFGARTPLHGNTVRFAG